MNEEPFSKLLAVGYYEKVGPLLPPSLASYDAPSEEYTEIKVPINFSPDLISFLVGHPGALAQLNQHMNQDNFIKFQCKKLGENNIGT